MWSGIFAPALTPQSIATARGEALNNVARDPELRQMQCGIAMASNPGTPEDLATLSRNDQARWRTYIRQFNISAD